MSNKNEWLYLDDGSILHKNTNELIASADLAWNSDENKLMIKVCNVSGKHPMEPVWVELTQVELIEIIFQLAAHLSGEYYPVTLQEGFALGDHLWVDSITGWYYYADETSTLNGQFKTRDIAKTNLDAYVAFMNQPNPFTKAREEQ